MKLLLTLLCVAGLSLEAAEDLSSPPITTARAWAIAEADTGAVIASVQGDVPQKSASITKLMCALVVLELAESDPSLLEELLTISRLADSTAGSTAEVKAGEKLTIRDALYALLLPSGNDIGNALAEHFNARLRSPGPESPAKLAEPAYNTRRNFVAEMNRTAARLGMARTRYFISYGDGGTADDRTTTAHDLILLARAALRHPLVREIVKTQDYTGKVLTPDGKSREGKWVNSNQLLKLGGYDGIKTGSTPTARSCLLAQGEHEGRRLIVVVLGSASDEGRYADARNLFRWAWAGKTPPASR